MADIRLGKNCSACTENNLNDKISELFGTDLFLCETNVTCEDYKKSVFNIPKVQIKRCNAVFNHNTNCMTVVVETDDFCSDIIIEYLDKRRMIGTSINVIPCSYTKIDIYGEISVNMCYPDDIIRSHIQKLFENFEIGDTVSYSSIYKILNSLECVNYVKSLNMSASGSEYRTDGNGDIILNYNTVACLNDFSYKVLE